MRLLLALLLATALNAQIIILPKKKAAAGGSVSYVGAAANYSSYGGTTYTVTLNGVTTGNLIVVGTFWDSNSGTISDLSSSQVSGGFTLLENPTRANDKSGAIAYGVATSTANLTVSVTVTANNSYAHVYVVELSGAGASPIEDTATNVQTNPGTGTDAVTSGSLTGSTANNYLIAFTTDSTSNGAITWAAGTGFTQHATNGNGGLVEGKALTSSDAAAATFTMNNANTDPFTLAVRIKP